MKFSVLLSSKSVLMFSNLVLLLAGLFLVAIGFVILCDWPRVLLSRLVIPLAGTQRLPQPPLYYIALVLLGIGLIICSAAILGCWSACALNYCILSLSFFMVFVLFLSHCTVYGMIWLWPDCLGLSVSPTVLSRTLQRCYGKPGYEQYTTAMDLAQVQFRCCGVSTSVEYDTALWRLESITAPLLTVPLTCCVLTNQHEEDAYSEPRPLNQTRCQTLELENHNGFRHLQGCIGKIESWYYGQYRSFMIISVIILLIEFLVLLVILLTSTKLHIYQQNLPVFYTSSGIAIRNNRNINNASENIYENDRIGTLNDRTQYVGNKNIYTVNKSIDKSNRFNS